MHTPNVPNAPNTHTAHNRAKNFGAALYSSGKHLESVTLLQDTLPAMQEVLGLKHTQTISTTMSLGCVVHCTAPCAHSACSVRSTLTRFAVLLNL